MLQGQKLHDAVLKKCDLFLNKKMGVSWHDLSDTVSVWDWIDEEGMTDNQVDTIVPDIVWDKLDNDDTAAGFFSREQINDICYGGR